jgi:hypothetical protein
MLWKVVWDPPEMFSYPIICANLPRVTRACVTLHAHVEGKKNDVVIGWSNYLLFTEEGTSCFVGSSAPAATAL